VARFVAIEVGGFARLRRRLRLGLADPLVADRFLLWAIGLSAMALLMASTILAPAAGVDPAAPGWVLLESLAGLVGAVSLGVAFFPSRAYRAARRSILGLRRARFGCAIPARSASPMSSARREKALAAR
jgi:hypothetical protein